MNYVLEFTGYYIEDAKSNKNFQLKEYCLIPIVNGKIEHSNRESGIVYPEYNWSQLSHNYQEKYRFTFYRKYGIEYNEGTCSMAQAIDTIIGNLKKARTIYLKNQSKIKFLTEFTGKVFKNVATLNSDYKATPYVDLTICPYHVDTRRRCSVRNAISMAVWVVKNELKSYSFKSYPKSNISKVFKLKPSHVIDKFRRPYRRNSPESSEEKPLLNSNRSDNLEHLFQAKTSSQEVNDGLKRAPKKFNYLKDSDQSDSDEDFMQLNFDQRKKLSYLRDDKKKPSYMDDLMEIDFENNQRHYRSINDRSY